MAEPSFRRACYQAWEGAITERILKIKVWSLEGGNPIEFAGFSGALQNLRFTPDGAQLLASGQRKEILVFDLAKRTERQLKGVPGNTVQKFALSSDGQTVAAVAEGTMVLWNLKSGESIAKLPVGNAEGITFHPDGFRLATAHGSDGVRLWDRITGQQVLLFANDSLHFNQVAFSPDGNKLAASDRQGTIKIWEITPRSNID